MSIDFRDGEKEWRFNSGVGCLSKIFKALSSISSTKKKGHDMGGSVGEFSSVFLYLYMCMHVHVYMEGRGQP